MESSIAEFLMRQLASEQLPTSHACENAAHRWRVCAMASLSLQKHCAQLHSQAAGSMEPRGRQTASALIL